MHGDQFKQLEYGSSSFRSRSTNKHSRLHPAGRLRAVPCVFALVALYLYVLPQLNMAAAPHGLGRASRDNAAAALRAGCYWRADENNPQLIRIRGTAWETPEQLAYHQYVQVRQDVACKGGARAIAPKPP